MQPESKAARIVALKTAAAIVAPPVDIDLHPVGIGPVGSLVAAWSMDDVHVDSRRLIDLAREPDDGFRRRLEHRLLTGARNEGDEAIVDDQSPVCCLPDRAIGSRGGRRMGQARAERCRSRDD